MAPDSRSGYDRGMFNARNAQSLRLTLSRALCLLVLLLGVGCGAEDPEVALVPATISDAPSPQDMSASDGGGVDEVGADDVDLEGDDTSFDALATDSATLADPDAGDAPEDVVMTDASVTAPEYPMDDSLRLNHMQALGTHNSYHQQPQAPLHPSHKYTMPSLTDQLELHGVRQFEWDLHLHLEGQLEVFHIPLIDHVSSCTLFLDCLEETRAWSDAHPGHAPLVIWMELKDDVDTGVLGDYVPLAGHYDEVEATILEVFEPARILTPDEVRGDHETLPAALEAEGWPTLGSLRGRLVFVFLEDGAHRDAYLEGSPNLEGKLLFVDSDDPSQGFAGFFKINNAQGDFDLVQERVNAGFIVTSNVDDVDGTQEGNAAKLAASLESGTHFLSTNYPAVKTDGSYYGEIPGGAPVRCNPLTAPAECTANALEHLQ